MSTLRKDNTEATDALADNGQRIYDERLRAQLEPEHNNQFVAIEPESERYFLGSTGLEALHAGREAIPDKLFYLLRVGSDAAYRVGGYGARRRLPQCSA
jgi:hypothetical protein